jgi:hypothetical protein
MQKSQTSESISMKKKEEEEGLFNMSGALFFDHEKKFEKVVLLM